MTTEPHAASFLNDPALVGGRAAQSAKKGRGTDAYAKADGDLGGAGTGDHGAFCPAHGTPEEFTAVAVANNNLQTGVGTVLISIDRWSTDAERTRLVTTLREKGPEALLDELQDMKPVGRIRRPDSSYRFHVLELVERRLSGPFSRNVVTSLVRFRVGGPAIEKRGHCPFSPFEGCCWQRPRQ